MPTNVYNHNHPNAIQVRVIQSQHCIEVEGLQIELIYLFGCNELHVYLEDKLILSTQMKINKTQVNYTNLIEVAVHYWLLEQKRKKIIEKEQSQDLTPKVEQPTTKELHQYILDSITTVTE